MVDALALVAARGRVTVAFRERGPPSPPCSSERRLNHAFQGSSDFQRELNPSNHNAQGKLTPELPVFNICLLSPWAARLSCETPVRTVAGSSFIRECRCFVVGKRGRRREQVNYREAG